MNVLAVDTSHPSGRLAVAVNGGEPRARDLGRPGEHVAGITSAAHELLVDAGLRPDDLDRVALVIGPGSFTGLRVGLAFAKGLIASLGVDVVAIDTLRLLALPHMKDVGAVASVVDARKGEVYAAVFSRTSGGVVDEMAGGEIDRPFAGASGDLKAATIVVPGAWSPEAFFSAAEAFSPLYVGSGARACAAAAASMEHGRLGPETPPDVAFLCRIAPNLRPLAASDARRLEPIYLRPPDTHRGRLGPVRDG